MTPSTSSPANTASAAERARIGAILGSDEATGHEASAQHLAFATSLSVEDARAVLLTLPAATPPQPAPGLRAKDAPLGIVTVTVTDLDRN